MTTTLITQTGQYAASGFRMWRLDAFCDVTPSASTAQAFVGAGLASVSVTAEVETGTEITAKGADGIVYFDVKDIDRIKGFNLEVNLVMWDYELLEAAAGGSLITGGTSISPSSWRNKTIGWAAPAADVATQTPVGFELWCKTAFNTGACGAADVDNPLYIRHIFPRSTLALGDRTFEDGNAAFMQLKGFSQANPKLFARLASLTSGDDGEGWIGPATIPDELTKTPYAQMFSNSLPTAGAGPGFYTEYDLT